MSNLNHEEQVYEFFQRLKTQDPKHWAETCEKYPTLSPNRIRRLRRRERCVGLLGLQPVALPATTLSKYNMDGVFEE